MKFRSSVVLSSSNQESNKSSKDGGGKRHLSSSSDSRFISPPHTLKPLPKPSSHTMQGFESDTFGKKQVPSALTSLSPRISKSPPPPPFLFDCQLPFRLRGNRRTSSSVRQSFRFSSPSLPLVRKSRQLMLSVQKKKKKRKETGRKGRKCSGRNQTGKLLRKEMGRTAAADKKRSLIAFLPPFRSVGNVRKSVPENARQKKYVKVQA